MEYRFEKKIILQFCFLVLFKIMLEFSFIFFLEPLDITYTLDVNIFKYINGWIWVVLIFFAISLQKEQKISRMILYLHLYIGIVPITLIYSLMNENAICFNCMCTMYFVVSLCMLTKFNASIKLNNHLDYMSSFFKQGIVCLSVASVLIVLGYCIIKNGIPSLKAINMSNVYEVRANQFIQNKYISYLYEIINYGVIPFLLALCIEQKKYISFFMLICIIVLLFLYSGNKTSFLSLIIVFAILIVCNFRDADRKLFNLFCFGVIGAILIWIVFNQYFFYTLFVRRMMIVSAHLKFLHYDFFSFMPHEGMAGTLLGMINGDNGIAYQGYFFSESLDKAIGRIMLNRPQMACNTGFLIEGYDRYGYIGFVIVGFFYFLCLKIIDNLQKNTNYRFAALTTFYFFFSLNDGYLLSVFGVNSGTFILAVAIFYKFQNKCNERKKIGNELGIKYITKKNNSGNR